jgi:hypothetical protein
MYLPGFSARGVLHEKSPRVMAVLDPVLVVISNFDEVAGESASAGVVEWDVPDFPHDPERGSHKVQMASTVYVDRSDVRLQDSSVSASWTRLRVLGTVIILSPPFLSFHLRTSSGLLLARLWASSTRGEWR